jgi:cholesterol oxidase
VSSDGSAPPGGEHDFDWLVIGSGFGGSVAALRLAEKGYRVGVLECGRRFRDKDFAKTTWNLRRYFWAPRLGLRGIMRMTTFRDVFIVSGNGVGGGSLGYANTLYRARDTFYEHRQWRDLAPDWRAELEPHYETAERMLGVTTYDRIGAADALLKEYAEETGVDETFKPTRVGVYLGDPGREDSDPFFGGEGPDRRGCLRCGNCMVGCRHGAKNTLPKNYLWFAEKLGVEIIPERQATDIVPLGAGDGSRGYAVRSEHPGAWLRKRRRTFTAGGIVLAAGALGTNRLLRDCKHRGSLPRLSPRLGELVRTNSESIHAVTAPDDSHDFPNSIAITSSIYPDPDTHIEVVSYGHGGNALSGAYTFLTGEGTAPQRALQWAATVIRHPIKALKLVHPGKWSRRTVLLLVMQTLDNAIRLVPKRRLLGGGVRLQTEEDPANPSPRYIPAAAQASHWFEQRLGGVAQAGITESVLNIPSTAHILGGAVIGETDDDGVVDPAHRVHGYERMLVCDGAAMPANPGVNPSLTITAMAERAIGLIPAKPGSGPAPLPEQARPAPDERRSASAEDAAGVA